PSRPPCTPPSQEAEADAILSGLARGCQQLFSDKHATWACHAGSDRPGSTLTTWTPAISMRWESSRNKHQAAEYTMSAWFRKKKGLKGSCSCGKLTNGGGRGASARLRPQKVKSELDQGKKIGATGYGRPLSTLLGRVGIWQGHRSMHLGAFLLTTLPFFAKRKKDGMHASHPHPTSPKWPHYCSRTLLHLPNP
ncbi:hypothetical protein B296_00054847, partial [Ensete ventricosum]